jgi:transcriptional regulator with XRE-family HTH domain
MGFKEAREKSGITQKELATTLGMDQSAISLWENGKTMPRAILLPKIAKILGCTVDELINAGEAQ